MQRIGVRQSCKEAALQKQLLPSSSHRLAMQRAHTVQYDGKVRRARLYQTSILEIGKVSVRVLTMLICTVILQGLSI